MTTEKRKLPIGIQTFSEIRHNEAYYYVDKTPHCQALIDQGKYYFLSRPRRFGKSLLIDTLKELFEGNEPLFRGLHIHPLWDWRRSFPVLRFSFGGGVLPDSVALAQVIHRHLDTFERQHQLPARYPDLRSRFHDLIPRLHAKYGEPVVVLVDEYDKPILDNITNADAALTMREGLKDIYSVIKDADAHIRFCLLTGVSKFSKVSLFSGLNNLSDITLDKRYATLCGYTDADINTVFAPELVGLDRDAIRYWYNGYNWRGEGVYNPFDLLQLFDKREFQPYWFETGTPGFLINLLAERGLVTPQLNGKQTSSSLLNRFDIKDIGIEALLFQTGYLTIKQVDQSLPGQWIYTLGYPNHEVAFSLNEALLPAYGLEAQIGLDNRLLVLQALRQNNFEALKSHFQSLFASLPHDWYRNNPIARYEGHYASIFYSHLAAIGLNIHVEDASNAGKVDMTVDFNDHFYLFEFKVVEQVPQGKAIDQLKTKDYAAQYRSSGKPIYLIGVEFSKAQRNIVAFDVASV